MANNAELGGKKLGDLLKDDPRRRVSLEEAELPLHLDVEAMMYGCFAASDRRWRFVAEFDTYDEVLAYIAKANGQDLKTCEAEQVRLGEMTKHYADNMKKKVAKERRKKSA